MAKQQTDAALVEHVLCPSCGGRRVAFGGIAPSGAIKEKPCPDCLGLGQIPRDHPSLEWADCPHCDEPQQVQELCGGEAAACESCGEPFRWELDGETLRALSWGQVQF